MKGKVHFKKRCFNDGARTEDTRKNKQKNYYTQTKPMLVIDFGKNRREFLSLDLVTHSS